jgi:peptide deformylase
MIHILQKESPVLRKKAEAVPVAEIGSAKMRRVLKNMQAALESQDDGVALAAPQIGVSLRVFIVSKAALFPSPRGVAEGRKLSQPPKATPFATGDDRAELKRAAGYMVFINPVITKLSRDKAILDEGCLSVRPLYGKIKRSKKAVVKAHDEHGKPFERGASGLLAQIFQHECDHLDGVLFIDKAIDVKELQIDNANAAD